MKAPLTRKCLLCITALLLGAAEAASAQNIYKCTRGGQVAYTDHPCPDGNGELLHQADDTEVIDRYLRLGQNELAQRYADSHHLEALYRQRADIHRQTLEEQARHQADEARASKQRAEEARQRALAAEAAERDRLQAENDALRQQNEAYQGQLNQPVYNPPPAYWGVPYPDRHDGHGHHGHQHPPPVRGSAYHPCMQLAGGRVQC